MVALPARARLAAAVVAAIGWIGLAVQLRASTAMAGSLGAALWAMALYFTVLTNVLLAAILTIVAAGRRVPGGERTLGGITLAILLVGVIYMALLRGLLTLSGGALLADILLHKVVPVAALLWWLAFAPHGRLSWRDPLGWALYPLGYFAYAVARGGAEGRYPYPFMDVARIGWPATLANAALIAAGFLAAGWLLVVSDRRLGRATSR